MNPTDPVIAANRFGLGARPGEVEFVWPQQRVVFGFSANGRLIFPRGVGARDVFIQIRRRLGGGRPVPGIRVLPGGISCTASNPNVAENPCDEDMP